MLEHLQAEVVVVGAGPAGIAAACHLAEAECEVLLVDENPRCGGQIWRHRAGTRLPRAATRWLERLAGSSARVLSGATVVDGRSQGNLRVERLDRPIEIEYESLILATGARELFLPFPGWTLPGVIGVGAAQSLIKAGVSTRGMEVVVAGTGPLLLPVAALLRRGGARVSLIAEQMPLSHVLRFGASLWRWPDKVVEAGRYGGRTLGVRYRSGTWVESAEGDEQVREVELTDGRRHWRRTCDLLCTAYGLIPNVELAGWLGCRIERGRVVVDENQQTDQPGVFCVGEGTGIGGVDLAIVEGEIVAAHLLSRTEELPALRARRARLQRFADDLDRSFRPRPELFGRPDAETLVCRCEDVPFGQLESAWTVRQAKLYTRLGMGPCQGRICGPAVSCLFGWEADTVRPPLKPCRVGSLAAPERPH